MYIPMTVKLTNKYILMYINKNMERVKFEEGIIKLIPVWKWMLS